MMIEQKMLLIDKKQLLELCPGLKRSSLEWLIRQRAIPLIKLNKRIYFDPKDIKNWIESKKIDPQKLKTNG